MKRAQYGELTVVVPNFNNSQYLSQCIESIVMQTYQVKEIIIVDDCSTDNSKIEIERLQKLYPIIHTIFLQQNGGPSNCRNQGLWATRTPYITFMDADDFYANEYKLENEMKLISEHKKISNEDIISYSKTVIFTNIGKRVDSPKLKDNYYLHGRIHFRLLLMWKWKSIMRDYCLRTDLLKNVNGYNRERNLFEDWELLLKLSRKYKFYCTCEEGPGHRESVNGLSSRNVKEYKKTINEIFRNEISEYSVLYRVIAIVIYTIFNLLKKIKHIRS